MDEVWKRAVVKTSSIQQNFGKAVRALRERGALTQEALADRAGIHHNYLGDVERGERNISLLNMQRIAAALGVRLSEILRDAESSVADP